MRTPLLTVVFKLLTYSGMARTWLIVAAIIKLIEWIHGPLIVRQRDWLNAMLVPLLAWGIGSYLKKYYSRKRPPSALTNYPPLVDLPSCGSFPSSHTAAATSFFTMLLLLQHPLVAYVGLWTVLVAFSRIYLGVHFLSDIIGGAILGISSAWIVFLAFSALASGKFCSSSW